MYVSSTKEGKYIEKAYKSYLEDDFISAKDYFEKAFKENPYNYVPALYLSYINEREFLISSDKKALKKAQYWCKKAQKLNLGDKNVTKQEKDIKAEFEKLNN